MSQNPSSKPQFPMETIFYSVIILIGVGLRFALLGHHPLNDGEASLALQALALSRGEETVLSGEPGFLSLTTVSFFIFSHSEFWVRFWPAVFGACAILLPLLYRAQLGRIVSLVLAGFIALDPVLIGVSRTADGSSMALVGLLAGIGFFRLRKPSLAGISLGIALSGGQSIWLGLLLLAGVLVINHILPGAKTETYLGSAEKNKEIRKITVTAVITLTLLSTLFFINPIGISAIGSSLAEYFASWGGISSDELLAWLLIEFPILILAAWGMVDGFRRKDPRVRLLSTWWGLGLVLSILTAGDGVNQFLWISIPILALAAIKITELIRHLSIENRTVFVAEALLVVALTIFSFLNLLALVNDVSVGSEETRNRIIGALLPIILLVILTGLLTWGWSVSSTRKGFIFGLLALISFALLSNTWKAASLGNLPEQELASSWAYPTGRENLVKTISDISRWNTGHDDRIDILLIGYDRSSLLWALRDFEDLRIETGFNPNQSASLIITGVEQTIESSSSYRGQKFLWAIASDTEAMKLADWVKWVIFRRAPVEKTELILWARNDLFAGSTTP